VKRVGFCFGPYHECDGPDDCLQTSIAKVREAMAYAGAVALDKKVCSMSEKTVREFDTGATRSSGEDRYDPEGYMSPIVEERFCEYMQKHQYQADGTKRSSDNWQKGMPLETYMQGMKRHVLHLWTRHRGYHVLDDNAGPNIEEDLCAIMFNVQGYLHMLLAARQRKLKTPIVSYDAGGLAPDATGYADVYVCPNPAAPVRVIQEEEWTNDDSGPRKDER
jgi:hypothetical protein